MDIQIVQDHHIAALEVWRELRADIGVESGTIYGPLDNPGSHKLIATQARDEEPVPAKAGICVRHLPKGASAMSRSPFRLRPRKGVMLVFTLVSSMKTSRPSERLS